MASLIAWVCIALGFFGLNRLLRERPQFAGLPAQFSRVGLVQESPVVLIRKVSDDVALVREAQPDQAQVLFTMNARRDYRGLRTIIDMEGKFSGQFTVSNPFDEPIFVLFKCRHPRGEQDGSESVNTSALSLETKDRYLDVQAVTPVEVLQPGMAASPIFKLPVHLVQQSGPPFIKWIALSNRMGITEKC